MSDKGHTGKHKPVKQDLTKVKQQEMPGRTGVTIIGGVTVGQSVIAAGAVVTSDVPPNTLVGGNPAGVVGPTGDSRPLDQKRPTLAANGMRRRWRRKSFRFSGLNKIPLVLLLSASAATAFASPQTPVASEPASAATSNKPKTEPNALATAKGLFLFDYEVVPIPGKQAIDLFGFHYVHRLNRWLYLGIGLHAPLVYGDYGGTMAADATFHAQRRLSGKTFVDAGISLGGGGGGANINQSKELFGTGGLVKGYVGLGYAFRSFSAGVNYSNCRFIDSPINHSQLDFFIQKPVSFSVGSYAYAGHRAGSDSTFPKVGGTVLTLELNNIVQVKPGGSNKSTINSLELQLSHFVSNASYLFFQADIGYRGLPLYNQVIGGAGLRTSISPRLNVYGQLGMGSGGYAATEIDMGPGLLVYPKVSLEYLWSNSLGLSLSSGYLFAPEGSSRNVTVGAAMNYHLSTETVSRKISGAKERVFRGFRFNLFQQTEYNVRLGNSRHGNINLLSGQIDTLLSDHWFVPVQVSVAYNRFAGYPGYGEVFAGIGVQNRYSTTNRFQSFFQVLVGANVNNLLLKPSIGLNYGVSDKLALYGQLGKTVSLNKMTQYPYDVRLQSDAIGLGVTYRFSVP